MLDFLKSKPKPAEAESASAPEYTTVAPLHVGWVVNGQAVPELAGQKPHEVLAKYSADNWPLHSVDQGVLYLIR
jgi:hypothetical protein